MNENYKEIFDVIIESMKQTIADYKAIYTGLDNISLTGTPASEVKIRQQTNN